MPEVKGNTVDEQTRCTHYYSQLDVIAIKFKCCNTYYPCFYCHEETASHKAEVWTKDEFDTKAILCGVCKQEMTIREYMASNYQCPHCSSNFNPKCSNHNHFYFGE